MYRMNYWGALALLGSLAGCPADKGDTDTDGATDATDATAATVAGTTAGTADTTTGTTGTTAEGTTALPTTTEAPTTAEPTTAGSTTDGTTTSGMDVECMARLQDCPEGLKCTAYAKVLQDTWDANKCVPEAGDGVAGDPCEMADADMFSGIDNCAKGYICLNTDDQGKNGFCVEFCQADDSCPNTTGGTGICFPANDGLLPICLATCDPLVQDCPGTQACYGDSAGPPFFCFQPDPQDGGQDGTTCEFTNACLPGLQCQDGATLEGCPPGSIGCCTPFCPLDGDVCTGAEECVAFFMEPVPGFENVGICVLPG